VPNSLACFVLKIDGSGGLTEPDNFYIIHLTWSQSSAPNQHIRFVCPTWAVTKTAHVIKKGHVMQDYIFSPRKMNDFLSSRKMLSGRKFLAAPYIKLQVLHFHRRRRAFYIRPYLSASIFSPGVSLLQGERVNRRDSETRLRLLRPGDKFESCLRPTETLSTYYN
jgi:hypothetical protein